MVLVVLWLVWYSSSPWQDSNAPWEKRYVVERTYLSSRITTGRPQSGNLKGNGAVAGSQSVSDGISPQTSQCLAKKKTWNSEDEMGIWQQLRSKAGASTADD